MRTRIHTACGHRFLILSVFSVFIRALFIFLCELSASSALFVFLSFCGFAPLREAYFINSSYVIFLLA